MTTPAAVPFCEAIRALAAPRRCVVVGTDTGVGKTVVSALLSRGLGATYWKPIQCGLPPLSPEPGDRDTVRHLAQLPDRCLLPEAYRLGLPASPHTAAAREGVAISRERLALPAVEGPLVVEPAGGLLVPLSRSLLQIELLRDWGLPAVLVTRTGLGTLNHTLLSLEALAARRIAVLGLVLNGPPHDDNRRTLAAITGLPLLAQLPADLPLTPRLLDRLWERSPLSQLWPAA